MACSGRRRRGAARRQLPRQDPEGRPQEPHLPDPAQRRGSREPPQGRARRAAQRRRPASDPSDPGVGATRASPVRRVMGRVALPPILFEDEALIALEQAGRASRSTAAAASRSASSSGCATRAPTRRSSSSSIGSTATRPGVLLVAKKRGALDRLARAAARRRDRQALRRAGAGQVARRAARGRAAAHELRDGRRRAARPGRSRRAPGAHDLPARRRCGRTPSRRRRCSKPSSRPVARTRSAFISRTSAFRSRATTSTAISRGTRRSRARA